MPQLPLSAKPNVRCPSNPSFSPVYTCRFSSSQQRNFPFVVAIPSLSPLKGSPPICGVTGHFLWEGFLRVPSGLHVRRHRPLAASRSGDGRRIAEVVSEPPLPAALGSPIRGVRGLSKLSEALWTLSPQFQTVGDSAMSGTETFCAVRERSLGNSVCKHSSGGPSCTTTPLLLQRNAPQTIPGLCRPQVF